ncbi:MAG: 30S ribosomal protein S7 [Rhizobacter sp.]|nr:30S ribosomal protein S7 [Chlorobiales bacterium]
MRRKTANKRLPQLDPKYGDQTVAKFVNCIMDDGKKSIARTIVYDAMDIAEQKTQNNGYDLFKKAIANVAPVVEVRGKRVGGATYQIPLEVRAERRMALAFRWIKQYASSRSGKSMAEKLAYELIDASNNTGASVKKKEELHKMADANKAFSHFRF